MLIRRAEVAGRPVDVRVEAGRLTEIEPALAARRGERILEAQGGALLPGLHDHHLHLYALAAAWDSIRCGPPEIEDAAGLAQALTRAPDASGWLRGTGYFESVAGALDRERLDAMRSDVPVRIQHRSGVMWFLNSRAIESLGLDESVDESTDAAPPRIERDATGRPTGRFFRADAWLRERLPPSQPPDLSRVGRRLAAFGVTAITDATPQNDRFAMERFRKAQATGALPQHLFMMGVLSGAEAPAMDEAGPMRLRLDAHKIMLDEPALPDLEALTERIARAHAADRAVAIHTVTRAELHFALAALESAGVRPGDRLEHASVAPPETVETILRSGLSVVTQPNFVAERGDAYHREVEPRDQPFLYRVRSWLEAGVRLGGGTDAPFGDPDPWKAMQAAVSRQSPSGRVLSPDECVSPETALALFLPEFSTAVCPPGARAPELARGRPADLCLLRCDWREARRALSSANVRATLRSGELIYDSNTEP